MRRKEKYRYNPEKLTYEKVHVSAGKRFMKAMFLIAPPAVMGFLFYLLFSGIIVSSGQRKKEREIAFLVEQLDEMNEKVTLYLAVLDDISKRDNEIYRIIFDADPFPDELRQMGTGGTDAYKHLNGHTYSEKIIAHAKQIDALKRRLYAQSISFDEVIALARRKEEMLSSIPAIQPVSNEDLTRIASGFGYRIDPFYKTKKMHTGLDFTADTGTPVYATGDGVVVSCEVKKWGYGQSVIIDHGYNYQTRYAHLSAFKCKRGDTVVRGQVIGLVGSTGKSTAPHLHYEVVQNGKKVDPVHFFHSDISAEQYEELIRMAAHANQSFD